MEFIKMHGLGNDFILLDVMNSPAPGEPSELARRLCDRHFSIGADGLVLIGRADGADGEMRIFNPDGSEPEMCGNAIRCVAKYLYESGHVRSDKMRIKTLAGMMGISLTLDGGIVAAVSVDMGRPRITGRCDILIEGETAEFMMVSTGNPHAVTYSVYPGDAVFAKHGPRIERNPVFHEGTNVEFCRLDSRSHITVRVWERGAGPTLACGTGATASFFAGVTAGILEKRVAVRLPGGELEFEITEDGHAIMTGPAAVAFKGSF
jgi:diaminopimelate epimerase